MVENPLTGKRKIILTVIAIIGAIIAATAAGMWLRSSQQDDASRDAGDRGKLVDTTSKEKTQAQQLALSGKTDEANKYIDEQLAKPDLTTTQKYDLYLQQGVILANQSKWKEAIASYKKAEEQQATREISRLISSAAFADGDKATAIAYWKKELTQMNKQSPLYDEDKKVVEQQIRDAGGSL